MSTSSPTSTRRLLVVPGLVLAATFAVHVPQAAVKPSSVRCAAATTSELRSHEVAADGWSIHLAAGSDTEGSRV